MPDVTFKKAPRLIQNSNCVLKLEIKNVRWKMMFKAFMQPIAL